MKDRKEIIDEKVAEIKAQIEELLDKVNFNLYSFSFCNGQYVAELGFISDAGEGFAMVIWFDGTKKSFVDKFQHYACDFDADEHAEQLVDKRGEGGVPSTIRGLIEDADSIQEYLDKASIKLSEMVYGKGHESDDNIDYIEQEDE